MIADSTHPEVTVGALIFNPEGKLLLVKSHKWHDQFVIPGGHVEVGEKIEDAVKREIKEETGLEIYDIKFIAFYECINNKNFYKEKGKSGAIILTKRPIRPTEQEIAENPRSRSAKLRVIQKSNPK